MDPACPCAAAGPLSLHCCPSAVHALPTPVPCHHIHQGSFEDATSKSCCWCRCRTGRGHPQNDEYYKRIPEASEDELDMLDLAFGLSAT